MFFFTGDGCSYSLYGVVDHDGSNHSGHYTAKCRNPEIKEWCEFNDTRYNALSYIISVLKNFKVIVMPLFLFTICKLVVKITLTLNNYF